MSVTYEDGQIRLSDACPIEEAETLVGLLAQYPAATVDIAQCRSVHGAVIQALLSFRPDLRGDFADPFLSQWVRSALVAATTHDSGIPDARPIGLTKEN